MTIDALFTTYWSQITLLLLAIGYIIKRLLDNKSKKLEVNHTLFQQNRITAVNNFFSACAKVELMWNQIAIFEILEGKKNAKEIDKYIFSSLNELIETLFILRIYFKETDYIQFKDLSDILFSINGELMNILFNYDPKQTIITKSNRFSSFKDQALMKSNVKMKELCLIIRKTYKLK